MANEFDKNKNQQQDPQQKRDQGNQGNMQDPTKKNPNTQDFPDKNQEGSEDVEKRRAS